MDILKKGISFFFVFLAGAFFGGYQIFWDAYELGEKNTNILRALYEMPLNYTINAYEKGLAIADRPVIAGFMESLNWGYLQLGIFLFIMFFLAFIIWPRTTSAKI